MPERIRGKVKWFSAQKGYGFITPENGGKDVFVHFSELPDPAKGTYKTIEDETEVEFEIEEGKRGPQAMRVEAV